jgi:hypothetical protein
MQTVEKIKILGGIDTSIPTDPELNTSFDGYFENVKKEPSTKNTYALRVDKCTRIKYQFHYKTFSHYITEGTLLTFDPNARLYDSALVHYSAYGHTGIGVYEVYNNKICISDSEGFYFNVEDLNDIQMNPYVSIIELYCVIPEPEPAPPKKVEYDENDFSMFF